MFGQLVWCFIRCCLEGVHLGMTRLRREYFGKIQLSTHGGWNSLQSQLYQMRQRSVSDMFRWCKYFFHIHHTNQSNQYKILDVKCVCFNSVLSCFRCFKNVISPYYRISPIYSFSHLWASLIIFPYLISQDLIRRCLTYNQSERPDVLTIAQDPYLSYAKR